jgi:alcohol dehydrogenase (cytochrome c)
MRRERAPRTSGELATAGVLIFAVSLDRVFAAYGDATGERLVSTRLNEVLNSSPITYAVAGKQYVAWYLGSVDTTPYFIRAWYPR